MLDSVESDPARVIRPDLLRQPSVPGRPAIITGSYTPGSRLYNKEIEGWNVQSPRGELITDEWIRQKMGSAYRPVANPFETLEYMAFQAAARALGTQRNIDGIVVSNSFPKENNLAEYLARALNLEPRFVLEVNAACAGYTFGLSYLAERGLFEGQTILAVSVERYSDKVQDLQRNKQPDGTFYDPSCAQVIFGDCAEAQVFKGGQDLKILSQSYAYLGNDQFFIEMPVEQFSSPNRVSLPVPYSDRFRQDGHAVYKTVLKKIPPLVCAVIEKSSKKPDLVIFHQAGKKMVEALAERPGIRDYPVLCDDSEGNMSSASKPRAIRKAITQEIIHQGHVLTLVGFGAGMHASAIVVEIN